MKPLLPLVIIFLIGTVSFAKADVLMLEATTGSFGKSQDMPFGTVSGPSFVFGLSPLSGALGVLPVEHLRPLLGQVIDQSGQLFLTVEGASINGQVECCDVQGTLNLSVIPSASVLSSRLGSPTLDVNAPFVVSGIVTAERNHLLPPGPPFSVNYFFEGTGMMNTGFRGSVCGEFEFTTPCNFFWDSSTLAFAPPTPPTIPEPSTLFLLGTGLLVLVFLRKQSVSVSEYFETFTPRNHYPFHSGSRNG